MISTSQTRHLRYIIMLFCTMSAFAVFCSVPGKRLNLTYDFGVQGNLQISIPYIDNIIMIMVYIPH